MSTGVGGRGSGQYGGKMAQRIEVSVLNGCTLPAPSARLEELERIVRAHPHLMRIVRAAGERKLPRWRLVAGGMYQTVWNVLTQRLHGAGIGDYDLIYFDGTDLSEDAVSDVERSVREMLPDLPAPVEVPNQ